MVRFCSNFGYELIPGIHLNTLSQIKNIFMKMFLKLVIFVPLLSARVRNWKVARLLDFSFLQMVQRVGDGASYIAAQHLFLLNTTFSKTTFSRMRNWMETFGKLSGAQGCQIHDTTGLPNIHFFNIHFDLIVVATLIWCIYLLRPGLLPLQEPRCRFGQNILWQKAFFFGYDASRIFMLLRVYIASV